MQVFVWSDGCFFVGRSSKEVNGIAALIFTQRASSCSLIGPPPLISSRVINRISLLTARRKQSYVLVVP